MVYKNTWLSLFNNFFNPEGMFQSITYEFVDSSLLHNDALNIRNNSGSILSPSNMLLL